MSYTKDWMVLPVVDLKNKNNWRTLGNNRYAALRIRILIVKSEESEFKYGPAISGRTVNPNSEITLREKQSKIMSNTDSINVGIQYTITSKICDQLASKVSAEMSTKIPGYSSKLGGEIIDKSEFELTEDIGKIFNFTKTYTIQQIKETEQTYKISATSKKREIQLRRRFWLRNWDIYLYSFDYLELQHRKQWLWWYVRSKIKQACSGILGWPLFRLTFYEPQAELDVCEVPVTNEIDSPDELNVISIDKEMPRSRPSTVLSLEDLAALAFPTTPEERRRSADAEKKEFAKAKELAAKRKAVPERHAKAYAKKAAPAKKKMAASKKIAVAKKKAPAKKKAVAKKAPAKKAAKTTALDSVMAVIKKSRSGETISNLKAKTGLESRQLSNALYKLSKKGMVKSKSRGFYIKG